MNKTEYQQYLQSDHWKSFKSAKEKLRSKRCSICADERRVELHHLFYRLDLIGVKLSDTRWLCRACHQTTHDLIKAGKLLFPKPDNHHSCFALTKNAVKKAMGMGNKNMFALKNPPPLRDGSG